MIEIQENDINKLKAFYIVHLVIYAIIIIFNFFLIKQIIWLKKNVESIFLSGNYFLIAYYIIPIIELFFVISNQLNKNRIILFRKFNLIFCILAIVIGLFFSILLILDILDFSFFFMECPFNVPITFITDQKCINRICIFNNENIENKYPYEYLCNYNPTKYFKDQKGPFRRKVNESEVIISEDQITCQKLYYSYNIINNIIYSFLNYCHLKEIYICQRFLEPKKYKLPEGYECPTEQYYTKFYIFISFNIIINIILSFIPWKLEINVYDKIISQLRTIGLSDSKNSTRDCSKITNDLEKNFKKLPTELIIVYNENNLNLNKDIKIKQQNEDSKQQIINCNITSENSEDFKNDRNIIQKKINKRNSDKLNIKDEEIDTNIINMQGSSDIFILNNKIMKANKKK